MASNGRRKKRKQDVDDEKLGRARKGRAEYVVQCIRDQPWLDGQWSKLVKLVIDRYPCSPDTAGKAVALAYQWLEEERAKAMPHTVGYLDRVHRRTIEMGFRQQDGRIITPAAAELRKLHGVGAPEGVKISGEISTQVSSDDVHLLNALKLTNAQRMAKIDEIREKLGLTQKPTGETKTQAAGAPSSVVATAVAAKKATEESDDESDWDDDE